MTTSTSEQAHVGSERIADHPNDIKRAGYSVAEVAAMFSISKWNVRMAIKEGLIR